MNKFLFVIGLLGLAFQTTAQIESTYYIPMPESQIHTSFKVFTDAKNRSISNQINTVISIVATEDNTIIYYDHWEDGYEWNITNPSKATTQIWGDNNPANGMPPGFSSDIINAGEVIGLENSVSLPRSSSTIYYDGRDKIAASAQLAVSRAAWAPNPGPVLSGAVEILETSAWGKDFEVPIGENISADKMFDYTSLLITAKSFFTIVSIDTDGDGNNDITRWLNQGDTYQVDGGIEAGAKITSTRPIQAHLITGDFQGLFENRWFTLFPCELWDNSYYSPIGTTVASDPVNVFLYNPNNSSIQIQYNTLGNAGSFNIASKSVYRFVMPSQSGAHFYTNDQSPFFAISTIDSEAQHDNDAHDWGFTLVPESYLTVSATIGWGPGSGDGNGNGSPAWVTATNPTTVYVDYDGNSATGGNTDLNGNKYDVAYNINAYESLQLYDNNDNDQTGMFIYTLDGTLISAAWGQDPATAAPGNPFLDFGTTVPPIRKISAWKDYELTTDYNSNGLVDQGDIITFNIHIQNAGNAPVYDINLRDTLPSEVTYIANSTRLNGYILVDDNGGTTFPLDEAGYDKANLAVNETDVYSFETMVNNPPPTITTLTNRFTATVGTPNKTLMGEVTVPVVGSTVTVEFCNLDFTNNGGSIQSTFVENEEICITVRDNDQNTNISSTQDIKVLVINGNTGDRETVCLTETGNNTGVFRGCINSSASGGIGVEDGTINAVGGDMLDATFTDPIYGEVCTNTAIISAPTETKVLYLTTPGQGLDRIDPVATNDASTATIGIGGGSGGSCEGNTATDDFNTVTFSGGSGWNGNWVELGEPDGPSAGDVMITTDVLIGGDRSWRTQQKQNGSQRAIDLSGATCATLEFYYLRDGWDSNDNLIVSISGDNGSTWTELTQINGDGGEDNSWQFYNTQITNPALMTANSIIRFISGNDGEQGGDDFFIDDLKIEWGGSSGSGNLTVRDEFNINASFSGNDGTALWSNDWQEIGESNGAATKFVSVGSNALIIGGYSGDNAIDISGRGIWREADLSGATSATLSIDISESYLDGFNIVLSISKDGGGIYDTWETYTFAIGNVIRTYDISTHISSNTRIRLQASGSIPEEATRQMLFDNIAIEHDGTNSGGSNAFLQAVDDNESTAVNTTLTTTDVTTNDIDAESETITVIDFTQASNGTAVNNGNGTFNYTPNLDYSGSDNFEYLIIDAGSDMTHHWGLNGNGTDGAGAANGTANGTTTVTGAFGDALSFNESVTDYVQVPDFSYNNEYTITFDFKIDDNTGSLFQYIYSHGNVNSTNSVNIFLLENAHGTDPNQFRTVVRDTDDALDNLALAFDASTLISDGLWHTYTLTVNSSGSTIYIDGIQQASNATFGGDSFNPSGSLYLGIRDDLDADRCYGGSLDNVQVYDTPLSTDVITDLNNETNRGTVGVEVGGIATTPGTFIQSIPMCTDLEMPAGGIIEIMTYIKDQGTGGPEIVRDELSSLVYSGNNGGQNWNGNWIESNDTNTSSTSGRIRVTDGVSSPDAGYCPNGNCLRMGAINNTISPDLTNMSLYRAVDLSSATSATLSYSYRRRWGGTGAAVTVNVEAWNGASYDLLGTHAIDAEDAVAQSASFDLTGSQLSASSRIRFVLSGSNTADGAHQRAIYLDNIQVSYATGSTVPTNPDITTVLKHDNQIFATLNNPVYNSGLGTLSWSLALGSNQTIPAGDAVSLEITQNDSGYSFELEYDSDTKPSQIKLPVTTVIEIEELAVYDAPYPGGSITQSLENGQTGYIRATVSDPFGPYDITGLDLNIYPPAGSPINLNLDEDDVAGTSGCNKIYEYAWKTSIEQGQFSIEAIAHEGYEGITDSLTREVEVSFKDYGTSCTIQFLDAGFNPTEDYAANDQICMEVTDIDENEDSLSIETVAIVLTGTGDTETVNLTETGNNTGVFQGCINSSSTGVGSSENGSLYAPTGSLITLEYIDPEDSTDICEAIASINTPTPTLQIQKTLVEPTDGKALVGDALQFDVLLVNTGSTTLTTVAVNDVFDNACMSYDSASISPNTIGAGTLDWTNIGPMSAGESKTLHVYFTAAASCNPAQNTASANGVDENSTPVSAGPVTAEVIITNPLLSITKTLITPASGPFFDDDTLVFQIDITNIGNTNITSLPLTDEFSGYCLEFQSASISPDGNGNGNIVWDDLGTLNVGNTISLTTQFSINNACDPTINEAIIAFAIDENGDIVPTVRDDAQLSIESPPVAIDDMEETFPSVPVTVSVLDNDYDINGNIHPGSVTTTGVLQPTDGNITAINPSTGAITYTPNGSFIGIDTYEYIVCDSTNLCDTALVTITIKANLPPNAVDDYSSTLINTPVDISVLNNDSDPDDGLDTSSISTTGLLAPSNGGITTNTSNGVITYTPNNGFTGNDNFEYQICDVAGACDTATVYVMIRPCVENVGQNELTGTIFQDVNGNGLYDSQDAGLSGVTLSVYEDINADGLIDVGDVLEGMVDSDGSGNYSYNASPSFGGTITYEDVPASSITINSGTACGGTPITRTITVTESRTITDIDFGFNASHAYRGDVEVTLQSPQGTTITLITGGGNDARLNYDLLLDDASVGSIHNGSNDNIGTPYYNRTVSPDNALSAFNGQNSAGVWIISICDDYPTADDGQYHRSQLIISGIGTSEVRYVMAIDENDLPTNATLSTDNLETAIFTATGQSDCGNDFGYVVPSNLTLTATTTEVNCEGDPVGTIDLTVTGGISPYQYNWSNGATVEDLSGLTAGIYSVTVIDNLGVFASRNVTVAVPDPTTCPEICGDGIDNDGDNLIDDLDPDCCVDAPITPNDIGDQVWLDINADGDLDSLEIGLSNVEIILTNQTQIKIAGIIYSPGAYLDTTLTDADGFYGFDNVPDGDWQVSLNIDTTVYQPIYDADGDTLTKTNFIVENGLVSTGNNIWCATADCNLDIDFGLSLNGNNQLGGTVCKDTDFDGICNSTEDTLLAGIKILLYDENGIYLGGVLTELDGSYLFPVVSDDDYIVGLRTNQQNLDSYHFTTEVEDTPASSIIHTGSGLIFQHVTVMMDIFGVDYGFIFDPCRINAIDDVFPNLCPGTTIELNVTQNDSNLVNTVFSIASTPMNGVVTIDQNGTFNYLPNNGICGDDQFSYMVCNISTACCDIATVTLNFGDTIKPTLQNVPPNDTIHCDEILPDPPLISAFDNCPSIGISVTEESDQGEDGCSLYDYAITRTWIATDICGNSTSAQQIVKVEDVIAPDIYKIYQLPNGKNLVAGVMEGVSTNWKIVNLPIDFTTKPIILTQITSTNEATPVAVQLRNISVSQFEVRIKEEEGNDNLHLREDISWVAIEPGTQTEGYQLEANLQFLNDTYKSSNFLQPFVSPPAFFASTQTLNEEDPVAIRQKSITSTSFELRLVEETSADLETSHIDEQIGYVAVENLASITDEKGRIFGETKTTTLSDNWTTFNLERDYINPVVIMNTSSENELEANIIRVRNVATNSFEARIEEWENEDGVHIPETVSYMVVEGSIPLDIPDFCETGTDSLLIGIDMKAIDNCDVSVVINYSEVDLFFGAKKITHREWTATDECGNATTYAQDLVCEGVSLQLKSFLQGALLGNNGDGLMRDDLRKKGLIPLGEPYSDMANFTHVNGGGNEKIDTSLLTITGQNGIVDWVFIELRAINNIDSVVSTYSGMIQCDGDIVSTKGDSIINFFDTPVGDYYVAIRHRNHLGMITMNPITFSPNLIPYVDFTFAFTPIQGSNPKIEADGQEAMWSGDLNGDGRIIYQGPNNDIFNMFLYVVLQDDNQNFLTNYIARGYTENDFNLDGTVIFQGPNNDRALLLFNTILKHPDNNQNFSNFVIQVNTTP